jgi:isopenicillin N synthase-like dioxygenase
MSHSSQSKEFFASPVENKAKCSVNSGSSGKNSGWFSMNSETLDPEKQKVCCHSYYNNVSPFRLLTIYYSEVISRSEFLNQLFNALFTTARITHFYRSS